MALAISSTHAATASTTKKEFGTPKVDEPPIAMMASGIPRIVVCPIASSQREPAADAERGERDDEGMRQAAEDVDGAVDGADRCAAEEHRQHHERRGID